MSALGSLTARLSCCCNKNAAVIVVPSSSCTRHCISSLFNVLHAYKNALIHSLAYVSDAHIHAKPTHNTSDNDSDVNFNRSFSGYGPTIHEDNTHTLDIIGFTSDKMHSQNAFLLCIHSVRVFLMCFNIMIPVRKSKIRFHYRNTKEIDCFSSFSATFCLPYTFLIALISLFCSSKC